MWQNLQIRKVEQEIYLHHNYSCKISNDSWAISAGRQPQDQAAQRVKRGGEVGSPVCSYVLPKSLSGITSIPFAPKGGNKTEYT